MQTKILGKNVYFNLNDKGLIECTEFKVTAETYSECVKLAKEAIKVIDESARTNQGLEVMVWTWQADNFKFGKLGKKDGNQSWIIYEDGSRNKESNGNIFIADKALVDAIKDVNSRVKVLNEEIETVKDKAKTFEVTPA